MSQGIDFRTRLLGAAQLAREAAKGKISLEELGAAGKAAGDKAALGSKGWGVFSSRTTRTEREAKRTTSTLKGLASSIGGFGAAYLGYSGVKDALSTTESLASETVALTRATNMSTAAAAQWVGVARVHSLAGDGLTKTFGMLSKNVAAAEKQEAAYTAGSRRRSALAGVAAAGVGYGPGYEIRRQQVLARARIATQAAIAKGAGVQAAAFAKLGITSRDLEGANKDLNPLMMKLSVAFDHLRSPVERNALANQIFGKSYSQILDLFHGGTASLAQNLKWARQYGVALGGESPKEIKKFLIAQEQAKYATLGLQTAIGTKLAPVLLKLLEYWPKVANEIRKGRGVFGAAASDIAAVAGVAKSLVHWFDKSKFATDALKFALLGLGGAWGIGKAKALLGIASLGSSASAGAAAAGSRLGLTMGVALIASVVLLAKSKLGHELEESLGLRRPHVGPLDLALKSPRAITPQLLLQMTGRERAELKKVSRVDTERHYPSMVFDSPAQLKRIAAGEQHRSQGAMSRVERQYGANLPEQGPAMLPLGSILGRSVADSKLIADYAARRLHITVVHQSILDGKVIAETVVNDLLQDTARH